MGVHRSAARAFSSSNQVFALHFKHNAPVTEVSPEALRRSRVLEENKDLSSTFPVPDEYPGFFEVDVLIRWKEGETLIRRIAAA